MAGVPRIPLFVWAALVVITVVSWWIGSGHGLGREAAGVAVLALATLKAAAVALEFMELRGASSALRTAVLAEIVLGGGALIVLLVV